MRHDFSVTVETAPDRSRATVCVSGDFDAACTSRFDDATADVDEGVSVFVVDLGETTIIDSAALGALIRLRERCAERDVELSTVVARPFQLKLLRITGLGDFLGMRERGDLSDPASLDA